MITKRTMGLDVGDKTIGVAISDPMGLTAQGLEVIRRKKWDDDLVRLHEIIQDYNIGQVVVGLPKNMNNTIGPRGEQCQKFADAINKQFEIPVYLWDERLSTVAAQRTLLEANVSRKKRKKVVDQLAAVIILQGFMDAQLNQQGVGDNP